MQSPKVSIIITTKNRPLLLAEAIQSVLNQDYADFELLVIDDASEGPDTTDVVSRFHDHRIRYIKNAEPLGSTGSLNVGLKESKGELIAILDDDDSWIINDKLSKQIRFLDTHPQYVLVATNVIVVYYDSDIIITKGELLQPDEEIRRNFLVANPIAHSSVLYRKKSVLDAGGYDTTLIRGKDYDLWLKLGIVGKMCVLPDCAVKYRESTFAQRNIFDMRLIDAKAKMTVILRYRLNYPKWIRAFLRECVRFFIFSAARHVPVIILHRMKR